MSDPRGGERVGRTADPCEVDLLACGCSQRPVLQAVASDLCLGAARWGLLDTCRAGAVCAPCGGGVRSTPMHGLCTHRGGDLGGDLVHCISGPSLALWPGLPAWSWRSCGDKLRICSAACLTKTTTERFTLSCLGLMLSAAHREWTLSVSLRLGASPALPRPYVWATISSPM